MLVALPHIALLAMGNGDGGKSVTLVEPRMLSPNWQAASPASYAFKPAFQNPAAEINTVFSSQGNSVGLYLGYYHRQTNASKLVSSNNALVTSKDLQWARVTGGKREIQLNGNAVVVRTAELRGAALASLAADSRLVVWQIYWINGTLTTSDYLAKVYSAFYRLTGRGDDSAVIMVYTPKKQSGSTDAVLESFLRANGGAIDELLQKARRSTQ
jgi:EpsI family protein